MLLLGEPMPGPGTSSVAAPAGTDQLDLEAAEQLIQLSGGDGADDDAGSETRSADSVKCCRGKEKEAAPAVESRRRSAGRTSSLAAGSGKDGDGGGESGSKKGADSSASACTNRAADTVGKEDHKAVVVVESGRGSGERFPGEKDCDGGIVHGEARRRPRFRSLADIYRETETRRMTGGGDRDHPPRGQRKKGKKRAAGEAIPGPADDAETSKERRLAQSTHRRM